MSFKYLFKRSPLSVAVKVSSLGLLLGVAVQSQASQEVVAPGESKVIEAGEDVKNWALQAGSSLAVNGATTGSIRALGAQLAVNSGSTVERIVAQEGSTVTISESTVKSAAPGASAMELTNGYAAISGSHLESAQSIGLVLNRYTSAPVGSRADVSNSTIIGRQAGASATQFSELLLRDSLVQGTAAGSAGVSLIGGSAFAQTSTLVGDQNGVRFTRAAGITEDGVLVLDQSTVEGKTGAAILVAGLPGRVPTATIEVNNGSQLIGGNGNLLEVTGGATANMTVNNSHLNGNVIVEAGSHANLGLQNHSSLTGVLLNVSSLSIGEGSFWDLTGDNLVGDLDLAGGTVKFGATDAFYQLNLDTLSGNGTFVMGADFAAGLNDFLNISGDATGQHQLLVASSGVEPVSPGDVHIVHTGGGDAEFSLVGGSVDLGAWSYGLKQEGNDWFLDPSARTISPGTRSVLALFNTAPTVWYGEASSLRSRMGELRHNDALAGGWIRSYGNKYSVSDASGVGVKQTQRGFSLGADTPLSEDSQWLVGVMAGHSTSNLDLSRGTSGTVKSYYAGLYATWMDADSGYYFDGVVKANRFENDTEVAMSDGVKAKGNYATNGIGASAEVGRTIKLDDGFFVEPFAQASTVMVKGKNFELDNGLQAKGENTHSLLGKLGVTVGRDFIMDDGSVVQPYLRTAVAHEFAKDNKVSVNGHAFNNDLSGSRAEFGAGVAVSLSQHLQLHADFEHSKGKHVDQPWGVNVGVRYSW
ncbi:autotransporter outer membrane beta-barrel domain-containing protein [Pseudomonas sp. SH10-3B]|uniref:autotransporter outer membrane beta-barrel domain-containing protein n=1 Tax=Pseudomonas sp. SH10-3B TaxID=2816049 RepID=UPI001CA79609|nr:autotransporter outer membrane beta-barrel domain-containing protein [Pseudomonas sp. SH10-3B]MBY8948223.1 autotransporter outer membrane beta-barrel domain-containing protein [Pseudomonas sp. SH10-3B]